MILSTLYGAIWAFLRRWFGGGYEETWLKNNRAVETTFMVLAMLPVFYFLSKFTFGFEDWINWLISIVTTAYVQAQFWSRGHGACFDEGRGKPDEKTIARYNERWYHVPCDWLFDKVLKAPDKKYGFLYDFIYMGLRYTMPMIPLMIFNYRFIFIGMAISPIYAWCWTLSEKESWIFKKFKYAGGATSLAEYLAGFTFGFGVMFLTLLNYITYLK